MAQNCCVNFVVYTVIALYYVNALIAICGGPSAVGHLSNNRSADLSARIIYILVEVGLGTLLLVAVIKKNTIYIKCYLIVNNIILVLATISLGYLVVEYSNNRGDGDKVIAAGVTIPVMWLMQYCVYLYYRGLKRGSSTAYHDEVEYYK